ncbi:MAG: hypothetical protein U1D30_08865 [Planctomycetota bacterium]
MTVTARLVLNSDGELILARFEQTGYEEDSRTKIIGPTWANPAFAGDTIYARSDDELVAVRSRPRADAYYQSSRAAWNSLSVGERHYCIRSLPLG